MKKILFILILILLLVSYLAIGSYFNILIPCPIKFVTNLYCPGCGVTRMLISILKGDFYQAFRYNPLLFIMIPFFVFYFIETYLKKNTSFFKKYDKCLWYGLIIIFVIYGVLRNIPAFSYLIPTVID